MGDDLKVVLSEGTSYVSGSSVITPGGNGKPGVKIPGEPDDKNYRPYILPGQDINDKTGAVTPNEFVVAWGKQPKMVTSNKWWSGALLQHATIWIFEKGTFTQRSRPMVNEPFRIDFVDMEGGGYPEELRQRGVRVWNQNEMYVFAGDQALDKGKNVVLSDNKFTIDNVQPDAPIVTIGLRGVRPLANPAAQRVSNVVVNDYSEFHVEMAYATEGGGKRDELTIQMANGVPYVVFQRTAGDAPFQLWAGSPVSNLSKPSDSQDTYQEWKTGSDAELGFKLGMRFFPAPPPGVLQPKPDPVGVAGYYVRADKGKWEKQNARYGTTDYYTWINKDATTVWAFAVPHNVDLSKDDAIRAAVTELMAAPAKKFSSAVLYEPDCKGSQVVNGASANIGYDQENAKITVGYQWSVPAGDKAPDYLALFPHHRKYMRDHDRRCFLTTERRPRYFYRTLKGEMWLYKGHEFVRELEVNGLLPFFDHLTLVVGTYLLDNPDGKPLYDRVYSTLREWFWREEKAPAGTSDSFAWNYFSYGGPEANPYMYSWAALIENLTVADQLASAKWDGTAGLQQDIDFKTPKWRVAALMRDKILETLKQLAHQWFDVYTAQCLQYNNKYKTICGYPEGYFCVQNLCDHHYHWGYFLRAAAAIGRHDPDWLERHWTALEMLIRDSANYDRKDTRFPIQRNFSAFYGHCWANGTARNNGQDHESASEALNFAFGMVELATLRGDPTMLAVGLWLYEEQVCATQQYWFNVDADLDNDPKDHGLGDPAYYNGNWPKKFVRFKRGDETWNTTIAAMVTQQSISRQTYFGGLQGCYSIHMVPVGAPNLYLERHGDWNDRTYKTYLQNIHTLSQQQQDSLPYENVIAMWQAAAKPTSDTKNLKPFEEPGVLGAIRRVEKQHVRYYPAVNSLAFSYIYARAAYGRLRPHTCSNAVHAAVFDSADEPNSQYFVVYNPSSKPIDVKFWDRKTGLPEFERYSVPERTFIYLWYNKQTKERADNFGQYAYTPSLVASPAGRLYLRKGASGKPLEGLLDSKPGTQGPDGTKPYPKDLSDSQLQSIIIKLGIGKKNATKFSGTFSGKLTDVFRYTRFSLFLNPVLYPGWTRDEIRSVGAGVEVLIEYDFGAVDGKSRTRTEFYGDPGKPGVADSKFNLETTNTWLNHNALTEYATTTVPLLRLPSLNPNKPYCEGVQFADVSEAKNATISVSIWQAENAPKKPDIYLSYNCPLSFEWASWIRPPYE